MIRLVLLLALFFPYHAYCQLESFCYDISKPGEKVNIKALTGFISAGSKSKCIYLFSESIHTYEGLFDLKNRTVSGLYERVKFDGVFFECPKVVDLLARDIIKRKIGLSDFESKKTYSYRDEYLSVMNSRLLRLIRILSTMPDRILHAIDIGTLDFSLGLKYLCLSLEKKFPGNTYVSNFCDSLLRWNNGVYAYYWEGIIPDEIYHHFNGSRKAFLSFLKAENIDQDVFLAWEYVFKQYDANYLSKRLFEEVEKNDWKMDLKSILKINSYRDEILFENFQKQVPANWNNLAISFSSLHLMNIYDHDLYKEYELGSIVTMGKKLHQDPSYRPYLKRIAFVCLNQEKKRSIFDHSHMKQSLEYKLSRKFDFAYVDLEAYRNSKKAVKEPFYLSPTLFRYELFNWENVFDGIVFAKDCFCDL